MNDVRVLFFARARDLAGCEAVTIPLREEATVADLRRVLAANVPALAELLPRCAIGVNGNHAADYVEIPAGAEVAVLPPVSGGCGG